jgi:hypothetical protein
MPESLETIQNLLADITIVDPATGISAPITPAMLLAYRGDMKSTSGVLSQAMGEVVRRNNLDSGDADYIADAEFDRYMDAIFEVGEKMAIAAASKDLSSERIENLNRKVRRKLLQVAHQQTIGAMQIGHISIDSSFVTKEPQIVEVQDNFDVRKVGTLRSDTDTVVKGKFTRTEIRIQLDFPDVKAINTTFRSLLAVCKAAPVLTIESDILVDILLTKYSRPDVIDELARRIREKIPDPLSPSGSMEPELDEFLELSEDAQGSLESLLEVLQLGDVSQLYAIARAKEEHQKQLQKEDYSVDPTARTVPQYGLSFSVALKELVVETHPEMVHGISTTWVFTRVNDRTFSKGKIRFQDHAGNPTFDMRKSPWIQKYMDQTYLAEYNPDSNPVALQPIPVSDLEAMCPLRFEFRGTVNGERKPLDFTKANCVIHDMSMSWSHKLAFLPLIGQHHPAVQHLGTSNLTARIHLCMTDRVILNSIHSMKEELDDIRRTEGGLDRDEKVFVENGLINLMGAREFVINQISTQTDPKSKDLVHVTMTLVESKYSLREKEIATLSTTIVPEQWVRALWDQLYDLTHSALQIYKGTDKDSLTTAQKAALAIVFGEAGTSMRWHGVSKEGRQVVGPITWKIPWTDIEISLVDAVSVDRSADNFYTIGFDPTLQKGMSASYHHKPFNGTMSNQLMLATLIFQKGSEVDGGRRESNDPLEYDNVDNLADPRFSSMTLPWLEDGFWDKSKRSHKQERKLVGHASYNGIDDVSSMFDWSDPIPIMNSALDVTRKELRMKMLQEVAVDFITLGGRDFAKARTEPETIFEIMAKSFTSEKFILFDRPVKISREFWDNMFEVMVRAVGDDRYNPDDEHWSTNDLRRSYSILVSAISSGLSDTLEFDQSEFKAEKKLKVLDPENQKIENRYSSNYPDLWLPRYHEFFVDEVDEALGRPATVETNDGIERELWRDFSPRYADLGIDPPYNTKASFQSPGQAAKAISRGPDDVVEPGFFYYRHSFKDTQGLISETVAEYDRLSAIAGQHTIQVNRNTALGEGIDIEAVLKVFKKGKVPSKDLIPDPDLAKKLWQKLKRGEISQISFVDSNGELIFTEDGDDAKTGSGSRGRKRKIRKWKGDPLTIRSPYTNTPLDHKHMLKPGSLESIVNHMPDQHFSGSRLYPTFRIFVIEEDRERLLYADDFYGVNCPISIEIRHSKREASLAILRIMNTTGGFEVERFLTEDEREKLNIHPDDEGEPFYRNFQFKTGTLIQVRMGYTSKTDDLPIVFSGKIVEVQTGPIITLICQDHRVELLPQVELQKDNANFFDLSNAIFDKLGPTPHLGRQEKLGVVAPALIETAFGQREADRFKNLTWWGRLFHHEVRSTTRNIYIQSNSPINYSLGDVFTGEASWGDWGASWGYGDTLRLVNSVPIVEWALPDVMFDNWIIPLQPAYDAFCEFSRHMPGTLCYVVPFEQDGTLFIGKPTQPYLASWPGFSEVDAFTRQYTAGQMIDVAARYEVLIKGFFASSRYGKWGDPILGIPEDVFKRYPVRGTPGERPLKDIFVSFQNAASAVSWHMRSVGPDSIGEFFSTLTFDDLSDESLYLHMFQDYTDDWNYIGNVSPDLQRMMVAIFFGWKIHGIWPGSLEGDWQEIFTQMMGRMWEWNVGDTLNWSDFKSQWLTSDVSPLTSEKIAEETYFESNTDDFWDSIQHFDSAATLDAGKVIKVLETLHKNGRISDAEFRRMKEQLRNSEISELYSKLRDATRPIATRYHMEYQAEGLLGARALFDLQVPERPDSLAEQITGFGGKFRMFVHYFATWLRERTTNPKDPRYDQFLSNYVKRMDKETRISLLPPGWKQFRDYHIVSSQNDIIENKITASMEQMHNAVLIRHPKNKLDIEGGEGGEPVVFDEGQDWVSWPKESGFSWHEEIGREQRKLLVKVENNANTDEKAARTGISNLAEAIRPMYRGHITLVGRPMKPHDVLTIYDHFTDMLGPVEVDEVVHHFNAEQGWTTTVVPCVLVDANDIVSRVQLQGFQAWISQLADFMNEYWWQIEIGLFVLDLLFGGAGHIAGAAVRSMASRAARALVTKEMRNRVVRFATTRGAEAVKRNFLARAVALATKGFTRGVKGTHFVGKKVLGHPLAFAARVAKNNGRQILGTAQMLNLLGYAGAQTYTLLASSSVIKSNRGVPIDIHPLFVKGRPYVAGIDFQDEDILSLGEKWEGWWKEFWTTSNEAMKRAVDLLEVKEKLDK